MNASALDLLDEELKRILGPTAEIVRSAEGCFARWVCGATAEETLEIRVQQSSLDMFYADMEGLSGAAERNMARMHAQQLADTLRELRKA